MRDLTVRLDDERLELLRTVRSATDDKGLGGRHFGGAGDAWRQLAGLGLLGVTTPPELGGGGGTVVDAAVVSLGLGETATELPYAEGVAAASALTAAGGAAERAVRGHCDGTVRLIPVTPAGAGYRTVGGAGFAQQVDGTKITLLVYDERGSVPALSVLSGVQPGPPVQTAARAAYFSLADVGVPAGAGEAVAEGDDARARWSAAGLLFRLLSAAELAGGARWLVQMADEYSRVRHQFGHPIGSYQGLQHVIVDMLAAAEATELLVFDAFEAWDAPEELLDQSGAALAFTRSSIHELLRDGYGVLGGIGFMEEHAISKYSRTMLHRLAQLGSRSELHEDVSSRIRRMQWAS
jgi:alkylation response protein AidB-like acyl-CoA dehydrogenase